ncbi:MAG: M28 family peptidase, partial [Acidobacteria bacterium]|nr:M28 family peptidase [Acidobacteriota bacterium]
MKRLLLLVVVALACWVAPVPSQEREDRTLLSWDQMRAIINEVSGERALHAVQEMVPYPRVRPRAEYEGQFRESEVMARLARDAGFSSVEIESFPAGGQMWNPIQAELWLTSPEMRKLFDVHDIVVSICSGSETGDVTADLVDVGVGGRAEDYAGKDVKGKILLGSGSANVLQRLGVFERGAVGVISYNPLHPYLDPDQIGSQSVSANPPQGRKPGFGWSIPPRLGHELAARLGRGERLTFRSIVRSETFPGEMETVHAMIPGDGSSTQAVAMSGHLYEGYLKQGANDDASGCAVTLEMGRALIRLVAEGKLPRPKRDIHFLWVPEIRGTTAWLAKHQDVAKRLVADLNYDMEGLALAASGSMFVMHRTPDTFPTWLNDVGESMIRFIAELNRERVRYRSVGYNYTLPVVAPSGSYDPLYFVIDKFYGASDHVVYMGQGIPSLMFITWPDRYYHSSRDVPEKLDPTQFKRVGVTGLGALTVVATADDVMAARVAAETLGRGTARVGEAQRKGLSYLADVGDPAALVDAYKEARNTVRHQLEIERAALRASAVLFSNPAEAEKKLAAMASAFDQRAAALYNEINAYYKLQAEIR